MGDFHLRNGKSNRNPALKKVEVSDAHLRNHESFGYNHFAGLSATLDQEQVLLQALDARGVHQASPR